MSNALEERWYVAAQMDMRVTTNPRQPVTYWLVTYRPPTGLLEIRFMYEQVGTKTLTSGDWQQIVRDHYATMPVS